MGDKLSQWGSCYEVRLLDWMVDMKWLYNFLFPHYVNTPIVSIVILVLRLLFGLLLMTHGFYKLEHFETVVQTFPSFLGLGSKFSLILVLFAELVCAMSFVIGFLFRPTLLPIIITMLVAFLWVHHASIIDGELSFIYLSIYVLLFITGPGLYSIDAPLGRYLAHNDDKKDESSAGEIVQ